LGDEAVDLIARALEFDPGLRPRKVREFAERIAEELER
jgi:hypothetical protein